MKHLSCLFITGVILFNSLFTANAATDEKKYIPSSVMNGTGWRNFNKINEEWAVTFKVCLIRGMYEGAYALDPQNAYEQFGPWVTFRELVYSLDRFYAEEKNLQIPVTYALVLITKNAAGTTLKSVEHPDHSFEHNTLVSLENKNK